ncbi:LysR family transcriptional regulator [Gluconacetobacter azotocaptans]|uniref:LysR substrate-binding domain-containing protein n=1 Tax=Gluconacetobacter azotocaptans TaxID=142834 RepID=UPI00195C0080|nr:LysR substrate-binding domain-containing protein [Gluconacetobacter azotocaptans]MBM9400661.1 LysR family transcriptional regulator [Gluconacetobacter azotocaptans]
MLTELKTFLHVARLGSFAAAASRVNLTQSAVSGQIRRLEDALGFPLFDRSGRAVSLNRNGKRVLAGAETVVAAFQKLSDMTDENVAPVVLRVGTISSAHGLLTRAMQTFRRDFPHVQLRIVPDISLRLLDKVDTGEIDVALMVRPPFGIPSALAWSPVVRQRYRLIKPADMPGDDWRTLVLTQPFVRYERTSFGGRAVDLFLRRCNLVANDHVEMDDIVAIRDMVEAGLGVAIIPVDDDAVMPPGVVTLPLGDDVFYRELGLMTGRQSTPAHLDALISTLVHR